MKLLPILFAFVICMVACKKREENLVVPPPSPASVRLVEIIDSSSESSTQTYQYDEAGRLTKVERSLHSITTRLEYANGQLLRIVTDSPDTNSRITIDLGRDAFGRVSTMALRYYSRKQDYQFLYDTEGRLRSSVLTEQTRDFAPFTITTNYSNYINGRWSLSIDSVNGILRGSTRQMVIHDARRSFDVEGRLTFNKERNRFLNVDTIANQEIFTLSSADSLSTEMRYLEETSEEKLFRSSMKSSVENYYTGNLDVYDFIPSPLAPLDFPPTYIKQMADNKTLFERTTTTQGRNGQGLVTQLWMQEYYAFSDSPFTSQRKIKLRYSE